MRGVRFSSLTEDLVVATKLVILFGVALIGIVHFGAARLAPLNSNGIGRMFLGAATVFFAYEGFELVWYDRPDMVDPDRTLPRSLYLSVAIVAAVYIGFTVGAQMLVSDHVIVAKKLAVSHDPRLTQAADRVLRLADGQVRPYERDPSRSAALHGTFGTAADAARATTVGCADEPS